MDNENYINKNFEKLETGIPTYQRHNVLKMQPNEHNHHLEAGMYTPYREIISIFLLRKSNLKFKSRIGIFLFFMDNPLI